MEITNISNIDSTQFLNQNYTSKDEALLNSLNVSKEFGLPEDNVELHVISNNGDLLDIVYDFKNYTTRKTTEGTSLYNQISVDPKADLESFGLTQGTYDVVYNFYRTMFSSSEANQFYITEISSDRTEVKVSTNNTSYTALGQSYLTFIAERNSRAFYSDFILNFGNNKTFIGVNVAFDNVNQTLPSLYIKLYEPLPTSVTTKDTFWLVENISDPYAFQVTTNFIAEATIDSSPLRGPNINIELAEKANLTTQYLNLSTLLSSNISSSYQQLQSYLEEKSIEISVDYSNFSNFIHFSSAVERLENFKYKLIQIQSLQADINLINNLNISSSITYISSSVLTLQNQLDTLIQKLDGYEYYLYYDSGSNAWPKSNTTKPYINNSTTDAVAITWFKNQLVDASNYDTENRDYVWNNLPEYITVDQQNSNLELFVSMLGQHYDYIWTYIKDITDLQVADNRIDHGISKDLVADTLRNFGIKLYTNSRGQDDFYLSLLGINANNSTLPSTGSLVINNYVSASQYTIPGNDIVKETYKRIYHNLPYLLKTKGTRRGLRALINCFGITDTILKIKEYGGNKKDQDIIEQITPKFNYGLSLNGGTVLDVPYYSSYKQYLDTGYGDIMPDTFEFRFKLDSANIIPTQSLLESDNNKKIIRITHTSGSNANIDFGLSNTSNYIYSPSIELPLYNDDWWTLNITRVTGSLRSSQITNNQTYTLTIGNKGFNGIQYLVSSSININGVTQNDYNYWWVNPDDLYPGGANINYPFYGILQEFRYWIGSIPINDFKDHILNPRSIVFNGVTGSYNNLIFRLPLGSELDNYIVDTLYSVHPSPTSSFWNGIYSSSAAYTDPNIITYNVNHETYLINTPNIGNFTEIDEKVRIATPNLVPGDVLTPYISIQKPEEYPYSTDLNIVEVAISPQDSINADIIEQLGSFSIDEYIGDPRLASSGSYPALTDLRNFYFKKYSNKENVFDLIKLLSYFDNSLFKMIKDFVPAKANLSTGLVINTNILERNKMARHEPVMIFVDYSGSIETAFISGSNGLNKVYNTSYTSSIPTISGSIQRINKQGKELFTGELGGTVLIAHSQSQENIVYELNHIATNADQGLHDNYSRIPFNPELNNVMNARVSSHYLKVDYSTNPILPTNYNYLTASLANLNNTAYTFLNAAVQDSNYTLYRHITPRYDGSKLFNTQNNVYNSNDISYGNNPVINYNSVKFAYFKEITSQSLTLPGRVNANIKYLIDSASSVVELTEANKSLFDVQSIFNRVDANVALDNINSPSKQKALNGLKPIYAGGFKYYPIMQNINSISSSLTFELVNPIATAVISGSGTGSIIPINDPILVQVNNIRFATGSITGSTDSKHCFASLNSHLIVDITKNITLNQDIYVKVSGTVSFTSYVSPGGSADRPKLYRNFDFTGTPYSPPPNGDNGSFIGGDYNYSSPAFWPYNGDRGFCDWPGSIYLPAGIHTILLADGADWNKRNEYDGPAYLSGQVGPDRILSPILQARNADNGMDIIVFTLLTTSGSLSTENLYNPFDSSPTGIKQEELLLDTVNPITGQRSYSSYVFTDGTTLAAQPLYIANAIGCTITFKVNGIIKIPSNTSLGVTNSYPICTINNPTTPAILKATAKYKTTDASGVVKITQNPDINYAVNPISPNGIYYYGAPPAFNYTYIIQDLGNSGSSAQTQYYFEKGKGDTDNFYYLTASHYMSQHYYLHVDPAPIPSDYDLFTQISCSFEGYENIELPFKPKIGDLVRLYDHDRGIFPIEFEAEIQEIIPPVSYPIDSGSYTNRLIFKINNPVKNQSCWNYLTQIQNFILLSKVEDETNVVLFTDKNPGQTSAGILLPEYLDPKTKEDAGNIVKRLKSQNLI
jgi:hypothetical protein